jgi:FdhE protein
MRRSTAAAAPVIMAALQVHWAALAASFTAEAVRALDVPGLCPLCGSLPVASVVYAQSPYQGYRYLHCALCAAEWHMVRVQCTRCGASGKSIAYQSATIGCEAG